jgi:outer membrane protein assembly factor BamB
MAACAKEVDNLAEGGRVFGTGGGMRSTIAVLSLSVLFVSILTCQRRGIPCPEIVYPFEEGLGVYCTAQAGTELRYVVDWGEGMVDTTEQSFAVCDTALMPVRRDVELEVEVRVKAISAEDPLLESDWASNRIRVATPGMVLWYWVTQNEDSAPPITAPVIGNRDGRELVYVAADDEFYKVYGVDPWTRAEVVSGTGILPDEGYEWISHPVWNPGTGHLLMPKDDGEFYAFAEDLSFSVWHYPGRTREDDLLPHMWGNMCVCESSIFIPCLDTIVRGGDTIKDVTKFYKLPDSTHMPVHPPFTVFGVQEVLGAPAVDIAGFVLFCTDSGYLYKTDPDLNVVWRYDLGREVYAPGVALGYDGVVYVGSSDGMLRAVNPDGSLQWGYRVASNHCCFPVVGASSVLAVAEEGEVTCLGRDGTLLWSRTFTGTRFDRYPALAANGVIYVQNDDGVLLCLRASNGDSLWAADCRAYYPGRRSAHPARGYRLGVPPPSPTIVSNGDVIVATRDALYCVLGSSRGQLDPYAPWPKWQRDVHNTGCMPQALGQAAAH